MCTGGKKVGVAKSHLQRMNIPGTQMTLVLVGKDLVLEGLSLKIKDKKVPGIRRKNRFIPCDDNFL